MSSNNKPSIVSWIIVAAGVVLFLLLFTAAPGNTFIATSSAVQIPQALQLALTAFLLGLLTIGFRFIFESVGLDLTGYATPLSGTLSAFVVGLAQNWINLQPASSDPAIQMILNILVVVVGGVATYAVLSRKV